MNGMDTPEAYRASASETIRLEHRSLADVLGILEHLLQEIAAGHVEPDFALLCTALYYIDDFAGRCHHPKEERLFARLRCHAPQIALTLSQLNAEHQRDHAFVKDLHCLLVLYQAGAPAALRRLIDAVHMYATLLRDHMRREEALLDEQAQAIPDPEWREIALAFAREDDPLFGPAPQKVFAKLRARIRNMLPTKLRRHASADLADEAC